MKFHVEKMMCGGCVKNVTQKLEALAGVNSVQVDLASKTAVVEGEVAAQTVVDTLTAAGYPTTIAND